MADDNKSFPFESRQIAQEELEEKNEIFTPVFNISDVRFGPKGYLLPKKFEQIGRRVYNIELRQDDTYVVTFPKCGTTWTQELVWLIANNFDFETAREVLLNTRCPYIELDAFVSKNLMEAIEGAKNVEHSSEGEKFSVANSDAIESMPSPRFLKSHLPMSLLPPKLLDTCKVVYVARDARDVAVSFYHHGLLTRALKDGADFKTYWDIYKKDLVDYAPFFPHVKEAWELRNHPNMLFLFYEELSKDLAACARRVAKFLGKDMTDEQLDQLCDFLYIDNFRQNKAVNLEKMKELGLMNPKENFIRKGKVGGWRKYFDEEMTREAENWIEENLRDTDLRFPQ